MDFLKPPNTAEFFWPWRMYLLFYRALAPLVTLRNPEDYTHLSLSLSKGLITQHLRHSLGGIPAQAHVSARKVTHPGLPLTTGSPQCSSHCPSCYPVPIPASSPFSLQGGCSLSEEGEILPNTAATSNLAQLSQLALSSRSLQAVSSGVSHSRMLLLSSAGPVAAPSLCSKGKGDDTLPLLPVGGTE